MKLDKSKTTVISVIALLAVCGGSFLAVRSLNNSDRPDNVAVVSPSSYVTTAPQIPLTEPTQDALVTLTTESTAPSTTENNPFTTFEDVTQSTTQPTTALPTTETTTEPSTTETTQLTNAAMTTTTQRPTLPTTNVSANRVTTEEAENVIQRAAVFSDGFLGYKFDPAGQYYYTTDDPWQRNFGFNVLYDLGAPFVNFYYDTFRCKFTCDKKDWMIQFWKGQYGLVFIGCEIGVYNKPEGRTPEHYDCAADEDMLNMAMTFYRKGEEVFTRNYAKYWWCTGFVPGTLDSFRDRSELSMRCRITMKNKKMRQGFCDALVKNGFKESVNFSVSGLDVFLSWT